MKRLSLFCLFFISAPTFADLSPLKFEPRSLAPFVGLPGSEAGLQSYYGSIVQTLKRTHQDLDIEFVVGSPDLKFLSVAPDLWSASFEHEVFSKANAFGRMLCPGHSRNKSSQYLVVVRADDPGDTLAHEYLHYLQAHRPGNSVCALYERLETGPRPDDLLANEALEYEVIRFLFDNRESLRLPIEAQAGMLEKLSLFESRSNRHIQTIYKIYGWKPIPKSELKNGMERILKEVQSSLQDMRNYKYSSAGKDAPNKGLGEVERTKSGIAIFKREKAISLPVCLRLVGASDFWRSVTDEAAAAWNRGAQLALKKDVFVEKNCEVAELEIIWDRQSGRIGDGILKLGEAYDADASSKRYAIVIREKEVLSYEYLLAALVRAKLFAAPMAQRPELRKQLKSFADRKLHDLVLNLIIHEMGHVLGLAHNFNSVDKSVMDYSDHVVPSDYDLDALRLIFEGPGSVKKIWEAQTVAPKSSEYHGN